MRWLFSVGCTEGERENDKNSNWWEIEFLRPAHCMGLFEWILITFFVHSIIVNNSGNHIPVNQTLVVTISVHIHRGPS